MSSHLTDSVIYGHLWGTAELHALLDDAGRVQSWLDILAALAEAEAELGLIPAYAAADIRAHAEVRLLDLERVGERTRASGPCRCWTGSPPGSRWGPPRCRG